MKKSYIAPNIILVKTDTESIMTLGSDTYSTTIENKDHLTEDVLSKNHRPGSLWDTSWEDEEEDE